MTVHPIYLCFKDPYRTPLNKLVETFRASVEKYKHNPYHIERLVKVTGKKAHIKFQTSQRVALMMLMKFACNPMSKKFADIRSGFGMEGMKIDGIQSLTNTIFVLISCCNLETYKIGMPQEGKFKDFSQPYLANIAECSSKTIYRHLKHLCKHGVMKQKSRHQYLGGGSWTFHTSCKTLFERMFILLGVKKDQIINDHLYRARQRSEADTAEIEKAAPPKYVQNPTDEYEFALMDEITTPIVDYEKQQSDFDAKHDELLATGIDTNSLEYLHELRRIQVELGILV